MAERFLYWKHKGEWVAPTSCATFWASPEPSNMHKLILAYATYFLARPTASMLRPFSPAVIFIT